MKLRHYPISNLYFSYNFRNFKMVFFALKFESFFVCFSTLCFLFWYPCYKPTKTLHFSSADYRNRHFQRGLPPSKTL